MAHRATRTACVMLGRALSVASGFEDDCRALSFVLKVLEPQPEGQSEEEFSTAVSKAVQGSFQSDQERAYYASPEIKAQILGKPIKGSGLSANQADASLAVLANDAVILTDESPDKPGPLKLAASKGAKIIHLSSQFASSSLSLGAFVASMV